MQGGEAVSVGHVAIHAFSDELLHQLLVILGRSIQEHGRARKVDLEQNNNKKSCFSGCFFSPFFFNSF